MRDYWRVLNKQHGEIPPCFKAIWPLLEPAGVWRQKGIGHEV